MVRVQKYFIIAAVGITISLAAHVAAQTTGGRIPLAPAPASNASGALREKVNRLESSAKTNMSDVRLELRSKIAAIGDERRKETALSIIGQFAHANTTATDHFTDVLDHLEDVLEKIESRTAKAKERGGTITVVAMAIQKARDAIAQARTAVHDQAQKSYQTAINARNIASSDSLTPDGQNNLISSMRQEFQSARNSLKNDIFALRDGPVKNARKAVHDSLKALMQIPDVDNP